MHKMMKTENATEIISSYSGILIVKMIGKQAIKAAVKAKTFVNLLPILSPIKLETFINRQSGDDKLVHLPKYFPDI
jgi:hypothetical protein